MLPPCSAHYYITATQMFCYPLIRTKQIQLFISITTTLTCSLQTILVTPQRHNMTIYSTILKCPLNHSLVIVHRIKFESNELLVSARQHSASHKAEMLFITMIFFVQRTFTVLLIWDKWKSAKDMDDSLFTKRCISNTIQRPFVPITLSRVSSLGSREIKLPRLKTLTAQYLPPLQGCMGSTSHLCCLMSAAPGPREAPAQCWGWCHCLTTGHLGLGSASPGLILCHLQPPPPGHSSPHLLTYPQATTTHVLSLSTHWQVNLILRRQSFSYY